MEQQIKENSIGQKVTRVTYFELNQPDQPLYFTGFDCFDLGIEIELSNGFIWHIGWKENDRPELGIWKYTPQNHHTDYIEVDSTERWASFTDIAIKDFELIYVCEEWFLPAQCIIQFENSTSVTIFLGEELNRDGSIPVPLTFVDNCEMYVFHSKEPPRTELVKIMVPFFSEKQKTHPSTKVKKVTTQNILGILILLIVLGLIMFKVISDN